MSMWCPECNRVNYNKEKCDFCGHVMEDTSKSYTIPKPKQARILTAEQNMKKTYTRPCDVCNNDIAVKAISCPHCGDIKSKNLFWKIVKIVAIVIAVLFIIDIILLSMGIVFFDDMMKGVQKQTVEMHEKTMKDFNKQFEKSIKIQPTTINIPNTYQSKLQEKQRQRQLEIQRKQRELQRLQRESELAKRELKVQMQVQ